MTFKLQTVADLDFYLRMLLYGLEGSQKTTWCAENLPEPVWVDFEHSTDTLKALGMGHIPVLDFGSMQDVKKFVQSKELTNQFKTVVIDTVSSLQDYQLDEHMIRKYKDKPDDPKRLLPLFQDFRISTQTFKEILLILQRTNINYVIVAHQRDFFEGQGDDKRRVGIGPAITPALSDSIRQAVSCVARMELTQTGSIGNKEQVRRIHFNPQGLYQAKNRYDIRETHLDNPTWDTLKGNLTDAT